MHVTNTNITLAAWHFLHTTTCPNEQLHVLNWTHWAAKAPASSEAQPLGFASKRPEISQTNWRSNSFCNLPWSRHRLTGNSILFSLGKTVVTWDNFQAPAQTTKNQNSPMRRTLPQGIQQEMKVIFIIEYSFLQLPEQRICKISKKTPTPHHIKTSVSAAHYIAVHAV